MAVMMKQPGTVGRGRVRAPRSSVVAGCGLALGAALLAVACQPAQRESVVPPAPVQADFAQRIAQADAEPQNWLTTGRTYDESRYSPLDQISEATVGRLSLAWYHDLDTERGQEATPLVVDGIMYTTSAWSKVQAFDAATGRLLWQHDPEVARGQAARTCCDAVNRGAAYWNGKVYVGALDGRLIALDAKTGTPVWSVQTVDPALHYAVTGAPRIVKGRVIIGNGGAEFGVRGYVSAYDAETGKRVWRFYTVPGEPGKADGEVSDKPLAGLAQSGWSGQWWTEAGGRGGGTVWDSMAYDPELDLLYLGVGNASYWNKAYRSPGDGDNLFVASVLALRPETGEYVWHYQETPGDTWDYTSTQHMILADLTIDGRVRKVLMHAPKNGYFFVLDRATGKVITARPYIPLNWSDGLDPVTGQPKVRPEARYDKTGKPWVGMPGPLGGHNWMPMSFHKGTGLVYFPAQENMALYNTTDRFKPRPLGANTAIDLAAFALPDDARQRSAALATLKTYLLAWDPVAQKEVWRAARPSLQSGGVLSTAGNLVFQGDMDGQFRAHDARTGRELWSFDGQNAILAAPVTYAVNGRQYVTVLAGFGGGAGMFLGEASWGKAGARHNRSRVLTFALDATAALPAVPETAAPAIAPPAPLGDAKTIALGKDLYHGTCVSCHGGRVRSAGVITDLRYSATLGDKTAFHAVVGEGILAERGMLGFSKNFSEREIEAIRAYIVDRARTDAAEAGAGGRQP